MREERLLSVGIDIGTSTTQCVFSSLTLCNTARRFRFRASRSPKNACFTVRPFG